MFDFIEKSVIVDYETGYLFQIDYLSENELRWTSLKERTDGGPMTGTEKYACCKVADNVFFINWIEASGLVVSQIINFKEMVAFAFMTWDEEDKRGHRGQLFHKGKVTWT